MEGRFVRPAPHREKHVHGELCFHTLTELDDHVAQAVAEDISDRLHKFGFSTDAVRIKVQHADAPHVTHPDPVPVPHDDQLILDTAGARG